MFLISACGRKEEETLEKGEYYIYYLNSSGTELSKVKYEAQSAERDELIDELVTEMMNVPGDKEVVSALDDKVAYERHELREDVVYLYFDSNHKYQCELCILSWRYFLPIQPQSNVAHNFPVPLDSCSPAGE